VLLCLSYFGVEDGELLHAVAGPGLLAVLALKIAVLRRGHGLSRHLPLLGLSALALSWLSSPATSWRVVDLVEPSPRRTHRLQLIGSLVVAGVIVGLAIIAVTAKLGPTSAAELESRQERLEERIDAREERREQRRERFED